MITSYDAAEFLQGLFGFNDDNEAVRFYPAKAQYISMYVGSDWDNGGFRDYDEMQNDVNGFYIHLRGLFVKKYKSLPF